MRHAQHRTMYGARLFFAAIAVLCFSAFKSCEAIKFRRRGIAQRTTITSIDRVSGGRRRRPGYRIYYKVKRQGKRPFDGWTEVSVSQRSRFQVGQEVDILYLDQEFPTSTIKGYEINAYVYIFGAAVLAAAIGGGWFLVVSLNSDETEQRRFEPNGGSVW